MQTNTPLLYISFAIGITIAVIGGLIDYVLSKRKNNPKQTLHLPGCILYVAGALGLMGALSLIVSFILVGSFVPALVLGAGILAGFYTGFAMLLLFYLAAKLLWSRIGN